MDKSELAAVLRRARDRVRPADVGLPAGFRRQVPGLVDPDACQTVVVYSAGPATREASAFELLRVTGSQRMAVSG